MSFPNGYRSYSWLTTGSQAWYSRTTASRPRRLRRRAHGLFSTKARFPEDHGSPRAWWTRAIAAAMTEICAEIQRQAAPAEPFLVYLRPTDIAAAGAPSMKAGMTEFCRKTLSRMTVCPSRRQRSASRRH